MVDSTPTLAEQIAKAAAASQQQRTGHGPKAVSVVLGGDTLVVTLHGALSPAELALSQTNEGAAQVQEFHRQLFLSASEELCKEIKRITAIDVSEAVGDVEPATGAVVKVFPSGTMVQVFLLSGKVPAESFDGGDKA